MNTPAAERPAGSCRLAGRPLRVVVGSSAVLACAALSGLLAMLDAGMYARLGLPVPGAAARALLPALRVVAELAGGASVGSLLFAAFVVPPRHAGALSVDGYLAVRRAAWAAGVAGIAALLLAPASAADLTGSPVTDVFGPGWWAGFATVEEPMAWLFCGVGLSLVAVGCLMTVSWRVTPALFVADVVSLLPPAVVGPTATGAGHDLATDAAVMQTLAAAVGTGVLVSLIVHRSRRGAYRELVLRRSALIAGPAAVVLAASGVLLGALLVGSGPMLGDQWGLLTAVRLLALIAAALAGAQLWRGGRATPAAAVLLTGFVLATALGVVLSRWVPPRFWEHVDTPGESLIGYDITEPMTALRLLLDWRVNLLFGLGAVAAAAVYLVGVRRLHRGGDPWERGRTVAWLAGCAVVLVATSSGIGRYSPGVFSMHMVGHMALNMLAPVLLALGGPVTLALRALRPAAGRDSPPGAREWLSWLVSSPLARALTHPVLTLVLFVVSFYLLYLTGLFDVTLQYHWTHQLMNLYFLTVGYAFFWPLIGVDPAPSRLPHLGRLAVLMAAMPFHVFFAVTLMSTTTILGENFYRSLALPWVGDLLADQHLGGGIAWVAGQVPMLLVTVAVLVQWSRVDAAGPDPRTRIDSGSGPGAPGAVLARPSATRG